MTETPMGQQVLNAKTGPLVLPAKAADETKDIIETDPDSMEKKKDDPNALRKRVTENELRKTVSE